jgi:ABC-type nickel/cobalt efflux system permease component RcnA
LAVVTAVVLTAVVVPAAAASAHPLGNFTVNTSSSLIVRTDEVSIGYVVDMAEIPAFRERRTIDADADGTVDAAEMDAYSSSACRDAAAGLDVTVDGTTVRVSDRGGSSLTFPDGAGGLPTLRLECRLAAPFADALTVGHASRVGYVDSNHAESLGWREVAAVGDGVTLVRSDVATSSETDVLRSYPREDLPLDVRTASLEVTGGGPRLVAAEASASAAAPAADGGVLASLVGRSDLTLSLAVLMIVVAIGVGALHALGPGHGKTLIGAYLVGGGGTIRHAVGVGAAVALMHTASVLALGGVVLAAERVVAPERVYPWLGVAAGVIAIVLGGILLRSRLGVVTSRRAAGADDQRQAHGHPHAHSEHEHGHAGAPAAPDAAISTRGLVALAFSGGALPSPTALVVLLGAVSIGRAALGLMLIAAFSLGLASALVGVGVLALRARTSAERRLSSRVMRLVPVASAAAITAMGLFLAVRGATQL